MTRIHRSLGAVVTMHAVILASGCGIVDMSPDQAASDRPVQVGDPLPDQAPLRGGGLEVVALNPAGERIGAPVIVGVFGADGGPSPELPARNFAEAPGIYLQPEVPAGDYRLVVQVAGFRDVEINVTVVEGATTSVEAVMMSADG